jgi:hypothetical protein
MELIRTRTLLKKKSADLPGSGLAVTFVEIGQEGSYYGGLFSDAKQRSKEGLPKVI